MSVKSEMCCIYLHVKTEAEGGCGGLGSLSWDGHASECKQEKFQRFLCKADLRLRLRPKLEAVWFPELLLHTRVNINSLMAIVVNMQLLGIDVRVYVKCLLVSSPFRAFSGQNSIYWIGLFSCNRWSSFREWIVTSGLLFLLVSLYPFLLCRLPGSGVMSQSEAARIEAAHFRGILGTLKWTKIIWFLYVFKRISLILDKNLESRKVANSLFKTVKFSIHKLNMKQEHFLLYKYKNIFA